MIQTVEAVINENGEVQVLGTVSPGGVHGRSLLSCTHRQ